MIAALIDNGSLEPAAHRNLRAVATAVARRTGVPVQAVSWKHSDRIPAASLSHEPAAVLDSWLRAQLARGERDFVFLPFFVSPQGAIGSRLQRDLERLQREHPFRFQLAASLADQGVLAPVIADRIRTTVRATHLERPPVIVVDHGGPSRASAALRNALAGQIQDLLGAEIGPLAAASMEGAEHPHNRPLFADVLAAPEFDHGDVVIAPLFLAPGRHAGPRGDLVEIATAAEDRLTAAPLRCHFTELIGSHSLITEALADALQQSLFHASAAA
ncbi:CbiX/SirB N-terminal domain-containing protein [Opitutus sp. ER46]|uniref:sirohydrochlorin chelatase n=1 Tax=Opitutus sp. ER46 TaxID=2161864 RepID=UPI000D31B5E8|nr:CbiX/SirB N-terminal domain-containing protein [Opitutus sp. ER46]PTX92489.1 cobalamin biosynthesis protein CbiX [Opitutus sp. ER46]